MIRSSRTHRLIGLRNIDRKRWHCLRPFKRPGSVASVMFGSPAYLQLFICYMSIMSIGHLMFVVDHPSVEQNDDFFFWRLPFPSKWHPLFFTLWLFSVSSVWRSFENLPAPPWFSPKFWRANYFVSSTKTPVFPMICWWFRQKKYVMIIVCVWFIGCLMDILNIP